MAALQNFMMVKQSFTHQETVWMGLKMSCCYIWMLWSLRMSATLWQLTNRTLNKMAVAYFLRCNILYLYWNVTEFLLKGPRDLKSILVDVIAWHRRGVKPIPEPGIYIYIYGNPCLNQWWSRSFTHIHITRTQSSRPSDAQIYASVN